MRKNKGLLTVGILVVLVTSSLYAIYSSLGSEAGPRHEGLGSLLKAGEGAHVAELTGEGVQHVIDALQNTTEWEEALAFLYAKGFQIDPSYLNAYQINMGGYVLSVIRGYTWPSPNGTMAEAIVVLDDDGRISAWIMLTNLPTTGIMDTQANEIPVMVFSNGMPVFFVTFYHYIGDTWMPYHYWWHSAHNHPNWYYSVYRYWWQYYRWWGIDWPFWYDGFFGWYYNLRFYYWSTWFPIGEASGVIAALVLALGAFRISLRRK